MKDLAPRENRPEHCQDDYPASKALEIAGFVTSKFLVMPGLISYPDLTLSLEM